jgi:amidophosphoribosyltransferase
MSDRIAHECGIALIRLLKPLEYYEQKYKSPLYGFYQLFLLMEKQHNRGQDGAGIGAVKLNMEPGEPYMFRDRSVEASALESIFDRQMIQYNKGLNEGVIIPHYIPTVKKNFDFAAEILMGHLRYGTSGKYNLSSCHPYLRHSNWATRNLMVLGNFNMTNSRQLNRNMIERGQHPIFDTDTQNILEEIGFHLDEEHTEIYRKMRDQGVKGNQIPEIISRELDLEKVLSLSANLWDGGYTIAGLIGNGDAFVMRDPHGIRPCFYFINEEVIAFASERVALMTIFNQSQDSIREVKPGHAAIIKKTGDFKEVLLGKEVKRTECSFERIYFSRGNDFEIYKERKTLGSVLVPQILTHINYDLPNTVFSYIPNTAEVAYYGLMEELHMYRRKEVKNAILEAEKNRELTEEKLDELILKNWPRGEKIAHKDIKLRTFISQEVNRKKLVSHVYDITYGQVGTEDNLVVLDDSIVRGTTLKESIIKILMRSNPKSIIIASTAPQIRYPDCYGIDMSELCKFVAFQAAISLIYKYGKQDLIQEVYQQCAFQADKPQGEMKNFVRSIYKPFTVDEISKEIATILRPPNNGWKGELKIIFQTIESLHASIPRHQGDWYFTGNYPTSGGYAVLNQAFINFFEKKGGRAYDF